MFWLKRFFASAVSRYCLPAKKSLFSSKLICALLESIGEEHTKLNNVSYDVGIYLMVDVCFLFEIKMFGIKPFSSFPVQKYCVHSEKRLSLTEIFCVYHLNLSVETSQNRISNNKADTYLTVSVCFSFDIICFDLSDFFAIHYSLNNNGGKIASRRSFMLYFWSPPTEPSQVSTCFAFISSSSNQRVVTALVSV